MDLLTGNGHAAFGQIAPRFAQITDQVLFADIWQRAGLSLRDRSLITVAALMTSHCSEQLPFHFDKAIAHGVSHAELVELITHLAFYSGWPKAASALNALKAMPDIPAN